MSHTVLITGGAGYIGSHIVKLLISENINPIIVDNLSTGNKNLILGGTFYNVDLLDYSDLLRIFKKHRPNIVIHLAASIIVSESVKKPIEYYRNNVISTLNLIKAMLATDCSKLIFASTAAVYGTPQELPIREDHPTHPINPYGHSKLLSEQIIRDSHNAYGLSYIIFRFFNVAGASPDGDIGPLYKHVTHLIPRALKTAKGDYNEIYIYGTNYPTKDGTAERDYIHVMDIAQAHLHAIEYLKNRNNVSEVFNLGYGTPYSVKEVIETVKEVTGRDFTVKEAGPRPGDPAQLYTDSTKAQNILGWKPRYNDIKYIIQTAWNWELRNS